MNNPDHISLGMKPFFGVKRLKFFDADPGWKKFGSGIRINIPDTQHCEAARKKDHKAAMVVPYLLATVRKEGDTPGQVTQLRARLQGQIVILLSNVQPPTELKT
jgi:hypothetical protein